MTAHKVLTYYIPTQCAHKKGTVSDAFVRPSVRPSVAYIANNSRTPRLGVPKFGMKVPHLRCHSHTNFKSKRWIKVTRPINADTHPTAYLPMRTYRIPLVVVVVVWRISRPLRGTVVERRSLTSELSLSCARPAAHG